MDMSVTPRRKNAVVARSGYVANSCLRAGALRGVIRRGGLTLGVGQVQARVISIVMML